MVLFGSLQIVLGGGVEIGLVSILFGMNENAIAKSQRLARLDDDLARLSLVEGGAAEGIGGEEAIVARVKPTRAKVFGMTEDRHADVVAVDRAAVVAPIGGIAANLSAVLAALRVGHRARAGRQRAVARFDPHRRRHANTEAHFFLVAEGELVVAREGRVPQEQGAFGPGEDAELTQLGADDLIWIGSI